MIRDLSDALIGRGHDVRLVTSHRGRPTSTREDGLEVVRQWRPPERPLNRLGLPAGTSAIPGAWWSLRRGDDEVVQAWTIPAALAAARSGKPSVFVFQGVLNEADLEGRPRVRTMLLRAARECNAVVTYSEVAAAEFERITGIEATAIEPGIRLDRFTPADPGATGAADPGATGATDPAATGAADPGASSAAILCAADPAEPRKRVDLLIEAFAKVREARPDAELWLLGPPTRPAPGIRNVDPGADQDALIRLYRAADVTVLPAFREAFGLVVVESLGCGTPVIGTSDGGAVPGIIGSAPVIGAIADPSAQAIADALLKQLDATPDPAACRRRAEEFGINRCAARFLTLYESLL